MIDMNTQWILCPVCGNKTRDKIRTDTVLKNDPLYCPKGGASETGSDSCRSRADSRKRERNFLTETADRRRKTAAMVFPIHGGVHIEIRFLACISGKTEKSFLTLYLLGFLAFSYCYKRGIKAIFLHFTTSFLLNCILNNDISFVLQQEIPQRLQPP